VEQVSDRHTRAGSVAVWIPPDQNAKAPRDSLTQRMLSAAASSASELASELAKDIGAAARARGSKARGAALRRHDVAYAEVTCPSTARPLK